MSIDCSAMVSELATMVAIPSVNPFGGPIEANEGESLMADYYETKLRELGLATESAYVQPGRRNVWGRLPGSGGGPTVLLAGHLDTVGTTGYSDPWTPRTADGKLHGRGSCDMKAGLAVYLQVVRSLLADRSVLKGDIIVAGLIDEEHAMTGSRDFGLNGPKADFAIIAEPTDLRIARGHKGQINSTIRTYGKSAHTSVPENGENAVAAMAHILLELELYGNSLAARQEHPLCGRPKFTASVIRGGTNVSSVPDLCEIDVDRRTAPGETVSMFEAEIRDCLAKAKARHPGLRAELLPPGFAVSPLDVPESSPVVEAALDAYRRVMGIPGASVAFPGSTDAPNLGCPTVVCGPGKIEQCHSLNEFVEIDDLPKAAQIYLSVIAALQAI